MTRRSRNRIPRPARSRTTSKSQAKGNQPNAALLLNRQMDNRRLCQEIPRAQANQRRVGGRVLPSMQSREHLQWATHCQYDRQSWDRPAQCRRTIRGTTDPTYPNLAELQVQKQPPQPPSMGALRTTGLRKNLYGVRSQLAPKSVLPHSDNRP